MSALNPLAENPAARKVTYSLLWVAGLVLGALGAGYGASDASLPDWYGPAGAVFAFVSAALGYQAASNTSADPDA